MFLRQDLQRALRRRGLEPSALGVLPRILLTTNGTVTDILEAYFGEPMVVVKLHQELLQLKRSIPSLEVKRGEGVLSRKIMLQGEVSRKNFLYAESLIVMSRLDARMQKGLLGSLKPIGQLLLERHLETFKEIVDCGREPAGGMTDYFKLAPAARIIFRAYRTIACHRPIMLITEKFPEVF